MTTTEITDTDRFDFIQKHGYDIQKYTGNVWCCEESSGRMRVMGKGSTARECVDAAIAAKSKGKL